MDTSPTRLQRNPARVQAALKELPDGKVVCTERVKIYVPTRFLERGLAYIGVDPYVLGIYGMTVQDKYYGVSLVNAMIPIDPTETNRVKMDGTEYLEFVFDPGSTVFKSTMLVKVDTLTYRIYDEILSGGRVPWYMGYDDLSRIFDTARYHAGANIGGNQEVTQMIVSIIARDPDDLTKPFRSRIKTKEDLQTIKPAFVSLKAISYTATNVTAKLAGNYQSEGIVSAIVNPSERSERIETLLRK